MRQQFERRGHHMHERLAALPDVTCVRRRGRSTASPTSARTTARRSAASPLTGAVPFAAALLEQDHVAVVPGTDSGFDTHVRLSFATSLANIDKGIDRIAAFLAKAK